MPATKAKVSLGKWADTFEPLLLHNTISTQFSHVLRTVNSKNFVIILYPQIALIDIFAMLSLRD